MPRDLPLSWPIEVVGPPVSGNMGDYYGLRYYIPCRLVWPSPAPASGTDIELVFFSAYVKEDIQGLFSVGRQLTLTIE